LGDSGQGIRTWVRDVLKQDLAFQHIRVIYPTAPLRPYTPMKGAQSNVWFDRYKISNDCPEHLESIDSMCKVLGDLVDVEVKAGVSKNRILVGHFIIVLLRDIIYCFFYRDYTQAGLKRGALHTYIESSCWAQQECAGPRYTLRVLIACNLIHSILMPFW
ncbi:Lysophospholipase-like protein 1, partial [Acipenser ruthenus]